MTHLLTTAKTTIQRMWDTKVSQCPEGKTTMMVEIPLRNIVGGEYGSCYGSGQSHKNIFFKYISFREPQRTEIATQVAGDNLIITVYYRGILGKRNMEEIERFYKKGFIKDISY